MWSVISDPNGGYVQGINQGNAQGTIQLQDTNMTMQNINTMQGIAQSSVQGLVQQPQQQQQQPQIVDNLQGTTQGLMGNAQAQPQIANVQGMTQGTMGNAQGIIFQQNGHSQGIGQPLLPNMTYIQGNHQYAGAGAAMGDCQQLLYQMKQMSVNNPMVLIALQELEKRMLTNMTPIQNMTGGSPGYNCQGLMYSNVQTQGIQVQPQGMQQVQSQGMSQFQQLGQYQVHVQQMVQPQVQQMVQPQVQQMVQPQVQQMLQPAVQPIMQQPVQQPIMQQLVQQPFVQQGAIQPSMPQLAVQQPVMQPAVQPVVQQQPLQQHVVHQPMQPAVQQPMVQQAVQQAVQLPVQPLVVQQPVTQQPVQQPVQQHAVQQFVQQPALQQPALQQVVQQPIVQQPVQPQMVPQPAVQQPPVQLTQPVVQQHVQLTPVTNQVMPSQNQILTQNQYQGILQVCNQGTGIPQTDQSQGLPPSENQVTLQCLNQGLQLGSQNASMQPVQGYLGMALQVLNKVNRQPPQLQREDQGVQPELIEVNSSLCRPSADHSKFQLDEINQTDKLCGQHGTEVGSQPDDQVQISQHDNTHLMQVIDSRTLQKSWPGSDSEMLLMTEVPEQTWLPLLPSLPPQGNEDQSPPVQSNGPSPQDSDYQFIHGEVNRDKVNTSSLVPTTINKVESSNSRTECLGGQSMADNLGKTSDAGIQMGPQLVPDGQKSSQNHGTNRQVIINPSIPAIYNDVVPCTENYQEQSDQMHVTKVYQMLSNADHFQNQNEDEMPGFSISPSSSTISTYNDMYRAMSMIRHDTSTFSTLLASRYDGCYEHLLRDMYQQHPIFTFIRQRRWYTSDDKSNQPEWQWCNAVLQNCAQLRPGVHQICLRTETKYKPPDRCSSDIIITAVGRQSVYGEQPVSLVDETKYKPPGTVQEEDKWHWCDGVPWSSLTNHSHSNQDGSPCQQYLEAETKFRPPDATHHM